MRFGGGVRSASALSAFAVSTTYFVQVLSSASLTIRLGCCRPIFLCSGVFSPASRDSEWGGVSTVSCGSIRPPLLSRRLWSCKRKLLAEGRLPATRAGDGR